MDLHSLFPRMGYLAILVGACALACGCATITRGTKDLLVVESEPAGAAVTLSNGMSGKTPASFKLPRNEAVVVKIQKEGYEVVEVNVVPQISGAGGAGMAGNVILGGLIGAAVDAGSGAMKDLRPNPVKVKLVAINDNVPTEAGLPPPEPSAEERLKELKSMLDAGLISEEEYHTKRQAVLDGL